MSGSKSKDTKKRLEILLKMEVTAGEGCRKVYEIPVCYGGEYGPDIENIAEHAGLSVEEVIKIHSSRDYLIYMLGFLPGFCYLGGLDERIHTPRLANPRIKINAGSVGIGGSQTGIYPLDSQPVCHIRRSTPETLHHESHQHPVQQKLPLRPAPLDPCRCFWLHRNRIHERRPSHLR